MHYLVHYLVHYQCLDAGVRDFFENSEVEVSYGPLMMGPMLFQDDVARLAGDLESAKIGNDRMEAVAETKLLDYNLKKSSYVVIAKKKERLRIENKAKEKPLLLCGKPMSQEK